MWVQIFNRSWKSLCSMWAWRPGNSICHRQMPPLPAWYGLVRAIVALNFKVPRPWSWISRVNQGQGYPKHFKGFSREPLKTLEISRVFQGYPWKPSNFKARLRVKISREVKIEARVECLKALSTFRGISRNPQNSLKLKWQIKE